MPPISPEKSPKLWLIGGGLAILCVIVAVNLSGPRHPQAPPARSPASTERFTPSSPEDSTGWEAQKAGRNWQAQADSIERAAEARTDSIQRAADKRRLAVLKKRFTFKADEVRGGGWYTHKNQTVDNSWSRNYLDAPVAADGHTYLRSNYHGEDWIFHTKVIVRVGDQVIESDEVSLSSPEHTTDNSGDSVWETIHFTQHRDNGILAAIAQSKQQRIIVRFEGDQYMKTFDLADGDRTAIRESYELSNLITGLEGW